VVHHDPAHVGRRDGDGGGRERAEGEEVVVGEGARVEGHHAREGDVGARADGDTGADGRGARSDVEGEGAAREGHGGVNDAHSPASACDGGADGVVEEHGVHDHGLVLDGDVSDEERPALGGMAVVGQVVVEDTVVDHDVRAEDLHSAAEASDGESQGVVVEEGGAHELDGARGGGGDGATGRRGEVLEHAVHHHEHRRLLNADGCAGGGASGGVVHDGEVHDGDVAVAVDGEPRRVANGGPAHEEGLVHPRTHQHHSRRRLELQHVVVRDDVGAGHDVDRVHAERGQHRESAQAAARGGAVHTAAHLHAAAHCHPTLDAGGTAVGVGVHPTHHHRARGVGGHRGVVAARRVGATVDAPGLDEGAGDGRGGADKHLEILGVGEDLEAVEAHRGLLAPLDVVVHENAVVELSRGNIGGQPTEDGDGTTQGRNAGLGNVHLEVVSVEGAEAATDVHGTAVPQSG